MIQDIQLRVLPQIASDSSLIINYISEEKGIDARTIKAIRIIRRSIDARQRQVYVNLTVRTYVNEEPTDLAYSVTEYPDVSNGKQVIVVGEGPAGLFAALRLIEHGLRPIVIERGKHIVALVVIDAVALAQRGRCLAVNERMREQRIIPCLFGSSVHGQPQHLSRHHIVEIGEPVDVGDPGQIGVKIQSLCLADAVDRIARLDGIGHQIPLDRIVGSAGGRREPRKQRDSQTQRRYGGKQSFLHRDSPLCGPIAGGSGPGLKK